MVTDLTPISEFWTKNPNSGNRASGISGQKIQQKFQNFYFGNCISVISGRKIQTLFPYCKVCEKIFQLDNLKMHVKLPIKIEKLGSVHARSRGTF